MLSKSQKVKKAEVLYQAEEFDEAKETLEKVDLKNDNVDEKIRESGVWLKEVEKCYSPGSLENKIFKNLDVWK